jgi:cytochrome o ubiquinol oxidase subunit II
MHQRGYEGDMARAKQKQKQRKRIKFTAVTLLAIIIGVVTGSYLWRTPIPVLQPAGPVAAGERHLLLFAFVMMLFIVIPVFIIAFSFAWRYRESNTKARYEPEWDNNRAAEVIWWMIPSALIVVLAIATWHGSYKYDPYRPLDSDNKALHVQVVALDWRWLFIYPDQKVASVNELHVPVNTPVAFDITADAPMNSFWIPQLGGQVYAMPGMGTKLHLMASRTGTFYGSGANITGEGFAGMNFKTMATSSQDFNNWAAQAAKQKPLTQTEYATLSQKSTDRSVYIFSQPAHGLYDTIIGKYMNMNDMDMDHEHMHMEGM